MPTLVALLLLPLAVIGLQVALGLEGIVGYSLYKLFFLVPPLVYCRVQGISVRRDILRWQHWRNDFRLSLALGIAAAVIFVAFYAAFGGLLIDKPLIAAKIGQQFSVTAGTILLIAPFTIVFNSLLEEFFYRGFAFGLMARKNFWLGTLLPAAVFTVQHLLFAYHWVAPGTLVIGIVAMFVFALVAQALYASADTIVAPWVLHICGDLAMMAIAVSLVW